jgi:hypothetical protein
MDALYSALFYAGTVTTLVGLFSLIRPLRRVGIRTRLRALLVATVGAVFALSTTVLPTQTRTAAARDMLIDQWMPEWHFGEYHERRIRARPAQLFAAIRRVRSSDIFLLRTLTYLRNPSRDGQNDERRARTGNRAQMAVPASCSL